MEGVDKEVYEHGERALGRLIPVELFEEIVALRRKLHETPELAFEEAETARAVREELAAVDGVRVLATAAGGTGVIAVIEGTFQTHTKSLRNWTSFILKKENICSAIRKQRGRP